MKITIRYFATIFLGFSAFSTVTMGSVKPAHAWFNVCNKSSEKAYVAFAYTETRDNRQTVNRRYPVQGISQWKTEGWWNLNPVQCSQVYPHELWRRNRYYYVYAENDSRSKVWGGSHYFCVGLGKAFTGDQADLQIATLNFNIADGCLLIGEGDEGIKRIKRVGFDLVDIGGGKTQNFTYTLQ